MEVFITRCLNELKTAKAEATHFFGTCNFIAWISKMVPFFCTGLRETKFMSSIPVLVDLTFPLVC